VLGGSLSLFKRDLGAFCANFRNRLTIRKTEIASAVLKQIVEISKDLGVT
jgi:hypothetical protein